MDSYNPGLHLLSTFHADVRHLTSAGECKLFFDALIDDLQLHKVGEVYHTFDNGGFTAVICLTESHVSIHTWPEHGLATFDVFLSNFCNDNSEKVKTFHSRTLGFFNATSVNQQEIIR